jgi:hypothetical protein
MGSGGLEIRTPPWRRRAVRVIDLTSPLYGRVGRVTHVTKDGGVFVEFVHAVLRFEPEQLRPEQSDSAWIC